MDKTEFLGTAMQGLHQQIREGDLDPSNDGSTRKESITYLEYQILRRWVSASSTTYRMDTMPYTSTAVRSSSTKMKWVYHTLMLRSHIMWILYKSPGKPLMCLAKCCDKNGYFGGFVPDTYIYVLDPFTNIPISCRNNFL